MIGLKRGFVTCFYAFLVVLPNSISRATRQKMLSNHKKHKSHKLCFCALCGHFRETPRCRILQQAPNIVPYLCGLLGVPESSNFKGVTLWPK